MEEQFAEHKTEPNSGLGKKPSRIYCGTGKSWTLFLRQAGAPVDNNIVESALKMAIHQEPEERTLLQDNEWGQCRRPRSASLDSHVRTE